LYPELIVRITFPEFPKELFDLADSLELLDLSGNQLSALPNDFGRFIKLAGDRTYADWNVTIINDEDFLIRNAMEEWSNKINTFQGNIRSFGSASPLLYKSQAQVVQYSKTGVPIRTYQYNGIYPILISDIPLSWASQNEIERFQVSFAVDYWEVSGGITGNAGGL
jgi:hypothetical protein